MTKHPTMTAEERLADLQRRAAAGDATATEAAFVKALADVRAERDAAEARRLIAEGQREAERQARADAICDAIRERTLADELDRTYAAVAEAMAQFFVTARHAYEARVAIAGELAQLATYTNEFTGRQRVGERASINGLTFAVDGVTYGLPDPVAAMQRLISDTLRAQRNAGASEAA